jgi:hypothetical protein
MKRLTALLLVALSIVTLSYSVRSQDLAPYVFPFTGKWVISEDAMLLDDFGLQDIQNLRKDGKHFKGVSGHTAINTSAPSTGGTAYPYILNGFHFHKDQPAESHVIVYAANSTTPTVGRLFQNTTAVPGAGNFSTTALWPPAAYDNIWRFSAAPSGNMVASNGDESLIWGGNEIEATSFITSASTVVYTVNNSNDYSEILSNTRQTADQVATLSTDGGNDSYTKLLLHMDGTNGGASFTDSSSTGRAVTPTAVTTVTNQLVFGTASAAFNGTGYYLTTPDSADFTLGTNLFTVDFRVQFLALPGNGTFAGLWSQYSDTDNFIHCSLYNDAGTYYLYLQYRTGGAAVQSILAPAFTPTVGQWYHIALIRGWAGDANKFAFTVNGALIGAPASNAVSFADIAGGFYVGLSGTSGGDVWLTGYIDEFRFTNGASRWASDFTIPAQAYGNASNTFLVGSKRPLQGVKLYVSSGNTVASAMTVKEWQGVSWTPLTITDNTDTGATLAITGTINWTASGAAKARYINGLSLYWYQFYFDAGSASIYYVTVDAPMQTLKNIWDGVEEYTVKCLKYDGTTYRDYTNSVNDGSQSTYADFSSLTASQAIYLGFLNPQQGINFTFVAGSENTTASTQITASFWNGKDWQAVGAANDATATSTTSFSKGGVLSFQGSAKGAEFKRAISDEYPLYYYKIQFANTLDADVKVSEITGIAYPDDVSSYKFSETFQNRLFLFNEKSGDKNKAIYSTYNAPDIMNGDDYGEITFGDRQELTAAVVLYNIYTNTAVEQMLVTKRNETYRLSGTDPTNWVLQKMSSNIGCVAPLSMVSAEMTESADVKRTVAIWQSDKAIVMSDGATIVPISDDIKVYFDPNDSRYIPPALQSRSVGWYDAATRSYKLLIASGASATYLNTELEYSLKYKEWTKVYRENASGANPLQSGWQVFSTAGTGYTYGGGKDGFVYRLENGNNWNSTANITSYLHTKDMILGTQAPLLYKSTIKYLRPTWKKKAMGNLTISHYGDKVITTSGVSGQMGPAIITSASTTFYDTQSTILGPWLSQSLKFQTTTNVSDGMELLGVGIYYEPSKTIR